MTSNQKGADPDPTLDPVDIDPTPSATDLAAEIRQFTRQIDSLRDTLPLAMFVIQEVGKVVDTKFKEFRAANCTIEDRGDHELVTVPQDHYWKFQDWQRRAEKATLASYLVSRSILVALVSQYDAFLGGLLKAFFRLKPELLNASERALTLAELLRFGSIEAATDHVIEKDIETVLRKSHSEQFTWMEGRFEIPLRKDLPSWPTFVEVTGRRNLFVHASGRVSQQYLDVCRSNGAQQRPDVTRGAELRVPQKYFEEAHECVFEIGVKLAHVLWRKLLPADKAAAEESFNRITYDLLYERRYGLAVVLLDFAADTFKKYVQDSDRRVMVINRVQAYKWSGRSSEALNILSAEDWSATADRFQLASAVLRDDVEATVKVMKRIGANGEVRRADYRDWPLFREIRKNPEFAAAFEAIFGEPIRVVSLKESEPATELLPPGDASDAA